VRTHNGGHSGAGGGWNSTPLGPSHSRQGGEVTERAVGGGETMISRGVEISTTEGWRGSWVVISPRGFLFLCFFHSRLWLVVRCRGPKSRTQSVRPRSSQTKHPTRGHPRTPISVKPLSCRTSENNLPIERPGTLVVPPAQTQAGTTMPGNPSANMAPVIKTPSDRAPPLAQPGNIQP